MINRVEASALRAELTVGMNRSYSDEKISMQELVYALTTCQLNLQSELNIKLSARVTPCRIVFSGQDEESVAVSFINYPRFPINETDFKKGVEFISSELMEKLSQNRIVIEYHDKTVMYE